MDFIQSLCCMFIFAIPLLYLLSLLLHNNKSQKRLPPSPKKLPLLGNLHQLLGDLPHTTLHKLAQKHGALLLLQLGSIPTLVISSAEVAKEIFKPHDLIFSGRPSLYSAKRLSYGCKDIAFAPYGEYWRKVRKMTTLELLSAKQVSSFSTVRYEEVNLVIDSIIATQTKPGLGSNKNYRIMPVNFSELMMTLANNVICRVAYGKKFEGKEGKNREILKETQRLLGEFNVADYYPWFGKVLNKVNGLDARLEKNFKELDELYDEVIQEHVDCTSSRGERDHDDLVDVLLRLQKDSNQTTTLSDNQIKGILTDMFIAGSDTAAATLTWTMTELIRNPSTMKKVQDEVRQQVKDKQRVEEGDLPKLAYLKMVIKETFRLHPPAPLLLPREITSACTIIGGYFIPEKTRVIVNAKAIGLDPNAWHEIEPSVFEPERFSESSVDYKGVDFELIPFGVGRRGCPGAGFAALLIELALANMLYCFDWSLPEGMTRDDIDMVEDVGLTTHKKVPLLLVATPCH